MQSNNSHINQDNKIKYILYAFLPLLVAMVAQYLVTILDVLVIFIANILSDEEISRTHSISDIMNQHLNQPMNRAYVSVAQYFLYIVIFGIWYYKAFCNDISKNNNSIASHIIDMIKQLFRSKVIFLLIIAGYAGQVMVDGILVLVRPLFTSAFEEYDELVSNVSGINSSWVMLIAVFFLAPIGEELLFRGLIQQYLSRAMNIYIAILLQGLLFGLYHGNVIQGVYAFLLGAVLGLITNKTHSVLYGIILHMAINISLLFVPDILLNSTIGCILSSIVGLCIFVVMLILALRAKNKKQITE